MRPYRDLAPASSNEVMPLVKSRHSRSSRRRHTAAEWDNIKDFVLHTYSTQTLDDTMRIVKQERGFEAGARQYKNKLAEWGVEKNFKEDDMKFVSKKRRARCQHGINTTFFIRGTQVDAERIMRFDNRLRSSGVWVDAYSPTATPDGIIYYTPVDGTISSEALAQAAHVYSPSYRWSNSAVSSHSLMKTNDVAEVLLGYGNTTRTVMTLQVEWGEATSKAKRAKRREAPIKTMSNQERESSESKLRRKKSSKHNPGPEVDASLKRHTHRRGSFFIAGSGLFRHLDPLQLLLCDGHNFVVEIINILKDTSTQSFQPDRSGSGLSVADTVPAYAIIIESGTNRTGEVSSVLRTVQQSRMISRLVGASGLSTSEWIGPWRSMADGEARCFAETATVLFGPNSFREPDLKVIIILVRFIAKATNQQPSLLRVVLAESFSQENRACRACHDCAATIDYIGPDSAASFQSAQSSLTPAVRFDSFHRLKSGNLVKQEIFHAKWTRLTNLEKGLLPTKHVRCCRCGGSVHEGGYRPHYIDMEDETRISYERWDPEPDEHTSDTVYNPHPPEQSTGIYFIENLLSSESESDEDHWDPYGQELPTTEVYDPFPSEDEENNKYVSKPMFLVSSRQ